MFAMGRGDVYSVLVVLVVVVSSTIYDYYVLLPVYTRVGELVFVLFAFVLFAFALATNTCTNPVVVLVCVYLYLYLILNLVEF